MSPFLAFSRPGLKNVTTTESGKVVWKDGSYVSGTAGMTDGRQNADYVTFDVGSGYYSFKLRGIRGSDPL